MSNTTFFLLGDQKMDLFDPLVVKILFQFRDLFFTRLALQASEKGKVDTESIEKRTELENAVRNYNRGR